jgi:hypothetical protein
MVTCPGPSSNSFLESAWLSLNVALAGELVPRVNGLFEPNGRAYGSNCTFPGELIPENRTPLAINFEPVFTFFGGARKKDAGPESAFFRLLEVSY